jgi:hypothetical protein
MAYKVRNREKINPLGLPCRKTMYNSREEAEDMIKHISETRVSRKISVYKCPVCGFWHLTSRQE